MVGVIPGSNSGSFWDQYPTRPNEAIIYSSIRPGPMDITIMRHPRDGKIIEISTDSLNYHPTFSPDGEWMVFVSEIHDLPALYAINTKKKDPRPRNLFEADVMLDAPCFSADGRTIYFVSTRDGKADIYSAPFMPHTTQSLSEAKNLTPGMKSGSNFNPVVSPDGMKMVFISNRDNQHLDTFGPVVAPNYKAGNLYLLDLTYDKEPLPLTNSAAWHIAPFWIGDTICYQACVDGYSRIYSLDHNEAITPEGIEARKGFYDYSEDKLFFIGKQLRKNEKEWDLFEAKNRDFSVYGIDSETKECKIYLEQNEPGRNFYEINLKGPNTWVEDAESKVRPFGEGTTPFNTQIASKGPFLIDKRMVQFAGGKQIPMVAVRGYFPTYNSEKEEITCYEDFEHVVTVGLQEPDKISKTIFKPNSFGFSLVASRDGKWFASTVGAPFGANAQTAHIWMFNEDGSSVTNVTEKMPGPCRFPAFSPDGKLLYFSHGNGKERHIWGINVDGTEPRELTSEEGANDVMPAVSPKGNRIVYSSQRADKHYQLFLLKLDEKGNPVRTKQLTDNNAPNLHASFSPDGKHIIFSTKMFGLNKPVGDFPHFGPQSDGEIAILDIKTKKITRLTNNGWENSLALWTKV